MSTDLRICPHCGASVSGIADQCPRCDGLLEPIQTEPLPRSLDDEEAEVLLMRPGSLASSVISAPPQDENPPANIGDEAIVLPDTDTKPTEQSSAEEQLQGEPLEEPVSILEASNPADEVEALVPILPEPEPNDTPINLVEATAEIPLATLQGAVTDDMQNRPEPSSEALEARRESTPPHGLNILVEDSGSLVLSEPETVHEADVLSEVTPPEFPAENSDSVAFSFENSKTAPLPPTEPNGGSTTFPRPAQPVPDPAPLPIVETQPKMPAVHIPPAPFTPPPPMPIMSQANTYVAPSPPMMPNYGAPAPQSPSYWLQQRQQAYLLGNYRLQQQKPNEIVLSYGKSLSFFWWVVGLMSGVGILWYFFILLLSGFRRDTVYVILEPDGYIYEEGSGAAHIRRRRSRTARRWGVLSLVLSIVSLFAIFLIAIAALVLVRQYPDELNQAYPEIPIFNEAVNPSTLDNTLVQNVKVVVLVLAILMGLSVVGVIGGILMAIASYIHAAAFQVDVAPLPDHR